MNSRFCTMPPTCGRICATTGATVRPASSVMTGKRSVLSVTTPTSLACGVAGAAALALSASPREQPAASTAATRNTGSATDRRRKGI